MGRPRKELPEGTVLVGGPKRREPLRWGNASSAMEKMVRDVTRPGYRAQWMLKDEVSTRLSGDGYQDLSTGEWVEISPWSVVKDRRRIETGTDASSGSDTTVTHRECVLMEIPEDDFAKLERKQELRTDLTERALLEGNYGEQAFSDGISVRQEEVKGNGRKGFIPLAGIYAGE